MIPADDAVGFWDGFAIGSFGISSITGRPSSLGSAALLAAWLTIRATKRSADREIEASQAQTAVAQKQIDTTLRLEKMREANEASAFQAMLEAAMTRPRRGGLGQKDLSEDLHADDRSRVSRGPCRSPVHHQGRVRGIARCLHQAG